MARPVSAAHDVPAGVEQAWAVLAGPQWPVALAAALSDGSELVAHEPTPDGGVRMVTRRRLPEGGPSFLRRFVPADGTVLQTDTWGPEQDGVRAGTWEVDLGGAPGAIGGRYRVEPAGTGSRWVVQGEVAVRVPLVGGRAEAFLAPLVETLLARQAEVLRAQLA
jgi:hypothetical protein